MFPQLFIPLFSLFSTTSSLNIVLYSQVIGPSHLDFANSLVDNLANNGHSVDLIIGQLNTNNKKNGTKMARRVRMVGFMEKSPWVSSTHLMNPFSESRSFFQSKLMDVFEDATIKMCDLFLSDETLLESLRNEKYDLALISAYDYCPLALFHKTGITNIALFNPTPMFPLQTYASGLPMLPSYIVDVLHFNSPTLSLGFWERAFNLLAAIKYEFAGYPDFIKMTDSIVRKHYGEDFPSVHDLSLKHSVLFVNSNELLEKGRPISHKVKYIGGINRKKPRTLSEEWETLLAKSKKGNIIFSLGTQVVSSRIPDEIKISLIRAFSHFPEYNFFWKYETIESDSWLFKNYTNVFPINWLPQTDILEHGKTIAFISHMGLNSYLEASYAGVPTISIPIFADQVYNALNAQEKGISVTIRKTEVTEETIKEALTKVIGNQEMKKKCLILSKMLKEKPDQPERRFIEWIQFAAKFKNLDEHLNLPSTLMSSLATPRIGMYSKGIAIRPNHCRQSV
ncbi:unnamed protein product, partial [Mesorhabditis belari]|uniref:glucuronosyltransferase n=1 Tax=Mesorhabditis belari TaxID=2138241 RepID=A0AAF3JBK3_9BILA